MYTFFCVVLLCVSGGTASKAAGGDIPCNSGRCSKIKMPFLSKTLDAAVVAEIDVSGMNKDLIEYIDSSINSTFENDIEATVERKQNELKTNMIAEYREEINKHKDNVSNEFKTVRNDLDLVQGEMQTEISDYERKLNLSEMDFINFVNRKQNAMDLKMDKYEIKLNKSGKMLSELQKSSAKNVSMTIEAIKATFKNEIETKVKEFKDDLEYLKMLMMKNYVTDVHELRTQLKNEVLNLTTSLREENINLRKSFDEYSQVFQSLQSNASKSHPVALTSCISSDITHSSGVIKFPTTKTSVGITDISNFKNTGKFKCEVPGVYLFSVFIAHNSNSYFDYHMRKNDVTISQVIVQGSHSSKTYHTGSGMVIVELVKGDTLYAYIGSSYQIEGPYSCINVVKI